MGRRFRGRGPGACVLVALVILSIPGLGAPIPPTPDAVEGGGPPGGVPAADDQPAQAAPSGSAGEDPARPEYPSSGGPSPAGASPGPFPLLANAIRLHGFDDAWSLGYRGDGVRVAVVDEGVDFGHIDLQGTQATVTNATSAYFGWPIAYDPKSLTTYLRTGFTDGTWFANTTRTGLGPFEVTHTIKVDGTNDFGDREKLAADPRDNSAAGPGGDKLDFDLTDLYVTRDEANWYFGAPVFLRDQNASFVLLIDVDNETSGAYGSPFGTVDTNTSHAGRVNDIAWSPDGTKVATVSGDRLVRIWDRTGPLRFTMQGHAGEPLSVAWSPDGTKVASADKDRLLLWDAATGGLIRQIQYVPAGDPTITDTGVLAFSPNGTWIAASTFKFVHVFNVATGAKFGSVWPANTDVNAVGFNGAGDRLAVALGDNTARVYAVTPLIFDTPVPAVPLYTLSSHTQPVLEVAWSPDGTKIVSGAQDDTAKLWDVATQIVLRTMTDHMSWVLAADWNAAGTQFVTSSRGLPPGISPSFAVWDSAGLLQGLVPQSKALRGVDWSGLGEIATAGEDLTGRLWTSAGNPIRILIAHRPDYALFVHGFSRYSDRENKYIHGTELGVWYDWNATRVAWDSVPLANVSGQQAAFQFGEALFNEFAIPRALLGDPSALSVELFSVGESGGRAQDTVPADLNVDHRNLDFSPGSSSLSAFGWRRIQDYRVSGLTSLSGAFHFGFHPGPTVQRQFGALGLLVVDGATPGTYDRVVLDMNDDKVFDPSDVTATRANPIAALDNWNGTAAAPGTDGFPDVSAGMIYFIADGVNPVPYSTRLAARKVAEGAQLRVPNAGDLVAFAGEFGIDPQTTAQAEHGTRIASAIVAQGKLPAGLAGTANASRLVTILNGLSDVEEAWTFAVEGYDGRPNTGDEAHVVLSPFNFPTVHHDGWDVFSRTADFLSTQVGENLVTFVASAGDSGFGYGTVLAPASGPSVIAAGRAGDFSLASSLYGGTEGPNPHSRNPAIPGSRGPTPAGFVKPELLAVDAANLAVPLHAAGDGSSAISAAPMVGSDVSAALVAGAAALVHQAFTARHGRAPTVDEVRTLLFSGADDTGHDVLTQGTGFLNVSRSVRLAAETADAGLEVSPSLWHPGTYRGNSHRSFTHLMFPGDAEAVPVAIRNHGASSITATVESVGYTKIGEYVHANQTRTDVYQPEGDIALWLNDSGVWKVDGATLTGVRVAPPIPGVWSNAELVKVTAYSDLGRLTYKIDTTFYVNYSYALNAYDWTIDWANWGLGFGPFPAPAFFAGELNTVAATSHQTNVLEVRAAFPAMSLHEGLVVSLEAASSALAIEGLAWTFVIEFYDRAEWPWVSLSQASVTVSGGGTQAITATLAVPAGAALGSYEGAILIRDPVRGTTTLPILVNVGAGGPDLVFGGNLLSTDLYDNHRLFGGYDRALASATRLQRPTLGDWRFFFFEIPDQGLWVAPAGYKVLVRSVWPDAPSDVDTFAFGRQNADAASQSDASWYGPFTLKQVGKSEELDKPEFRTVTNGPEDVIAYDLASGLNVLAFRAFSMRGLELEVRVSGQAGWVNVPTAVDVATPARAGRAPFAFLSNMDLPGLRASAVGPAQTTTFNDLPISQDVQSWWNFPGWGEWMVLSSFTYIFNVEKALILEVAIAGHSDVDDLDLAVFRNYAGGPCEWDPALPDPLTGLPGYWKACDLDPEEYLVIDCAGAGGLCLGSDRWNYNADGDADELIPWVGPLDGQYIVKVLGFTVNAEPGHFDLSIGITLDTGTGYQISEAPKPAEIVNGTGGGLAAFTRVPLNMTWDFPPATEDDAYGGAVRLGLPNAPGVVVVPAVVLLDRSPPAIALIKLSAEHGQLNVADNRTTNDRAPKIIVSVEDLERGQLVPGTAGIWLDGTNFTSVADVAISFLTRANRLGRWEGTISFVPPELDEGTHLVEASIADRAGNVAAGTFAFVVDGTAPGLMMPAGLFANTTLDTWTVSGTTDPFAYVNVRGAWNQTGASGAFSVTVPLVEGTNALGVTVADWFDTDPAGNPVPGNTLRVVQTVVRDTRPPVFDRFLVDPGGPTGADQAVVSGTVRDPVSASEDRPPQATSLVINAVSVPVLADGSFRFALTLAEGSNPITATLTDPVGNVVTRTSSVVRDTTAPALDATVLPGTRVTSSVVAVNGTTEIGALVTVNGISVSAPGGAFRTNVTLSPGANTIVVQAQDFVGNVAERRFTVTYEVAQPSSLPLIGGMLIVGLFLGAVVAFLLVRAGIRIPFMPRRGGKPAEGSGPTGEESEREAPGEPPESEEPAGDPRVARLETALAEGRISRDVYEENLRRIRGGGNG